MPCRLHIFGASGSGVTTLGRALATDWSVPCHDTDDYYWLPTEPAFQEKRGVPERVALMEKLFLSRSAWVLSGSLISWGAPLVPYFEAVVFVSLNAEIRLSRLKARESARYGKLAIEPGGSRHKAFQDFMAWNAKYEDPDFTGRSRASHEAWIANLSCPAIRVDSEQSVRDLVAKVTSELSLLGDPFSALSTPSNP